MLTCKTKPLADAVALAALAKVDGRCGKDDPIHWLLLDVAGSEATLTAWGSSIRLVQDVTAAVNPGLLGHGDDEMYLLPRGKTSEILGKIGSLDVRVDLGAKPAKGLPRMVEVVGGRSRFQVPYVDPLSFPREDHDLPPSHLSILADDLSRIVGQVARFVDTKGSRYALECVRMEFDHETRTVRLIATDGRRLGVAEALAAVETDDPDSFVDGIMSALIPAGTARALARLAALAFADDDAATIRIGLGNSANGNYRLIAEGPRWSLASRLGEGRFPRWQDVAADVEAVARLAYDDRSAILMAARLAAVTTADESRAMFVHVRPGHAHPVAMTTRAADVGSATVAVSAPAREPLIPPGGPPTALVAVDPHLFIDGLESVPDARAVAVRIGPPMTAVVIEADRFRYFLQPLSVDPGQRVAEPEELPPPPPPDDPGAAEAPVDGVAS